MSLPEPWVNRIFERLTLTYGTAFTRMYDGLDIGEVKANWGEQLSAYQQSPDAIRHGLENLPPDRPPTVLQFREACKRAPTPLARALPEPAPDPAAVAAVVAEVQKVVVRELQSPKSWALKLKASEESGERLSRFQRHCWREAMR